jgi:hypothetical protein
LPLASRLPGFSACWLSDFHVIDGAGDGSGAEPVVDVHDRDAGRARIQHCQKRSDPAEARAIPHTSGDRNDRRPHQTANHTRQRAFHARDGDDDARGLQPFSFCEQPMESRDADVIQPVDDVTHHFCRD